jgi:hypothetical protein
VSRVIVELTVSLDGYATGEHVDIEHPFGDRDSSSTNGTNPTMSSITRQHRR